ncbi:hypothetical protein RIF29_39773 [Crotalaria pallida]|uniref:RNase H type-1 domain-containing protein n=1 Tax=Crotalaria pallida TaxID=3830 RepID=A0AAN9E2C1_CROPI
MVEDSLHVLRDCPKAQSVWLMLLKPQFRGQFFLSNFQNWINMNLFQEMGRHQQWKWTSIWATVCASLWFWRNAEVHNVAYSRPPNTWWQILLKVQNYKAARNKPPLPGQVPRNQNMWYPPAQGWIRINSDGACRGDSHEIGCGGVLRGSNGQWIRGYSKYLGVSSSPLIAELWGVLEGMQLAWDLGFKKVEAHLDCLEACKLLSGDNYGSYKGHSLVSRINWLKNKDWNVVFQHTYRESNMAADAMARLSFNWDHPSNLMLYCFPPTEVESLLLMDLLGSSELVIQSHQVSL